jgi:hypothetical protein
MGDWVAGKFMVWLAEWFNAFIVASPEIFILAAMCCLLVGMTGSKSFMSKAGTCILLAFVGRLLSIALG